MKVTRKFGKMVYVVAWGGLLSYYSDLMKAEKEIHSFHY